MADISAQVLRFPSQIDKTLLFRMLQAGSLVTVDNSPVLAQGPSACGQVVADTSGTSYVVPVAVVPTRSKVSRTPAVFLERDSDDAWMLTFWIDLVRPTQGAGANPAIPFFPVTDVALALSTAVAGVSSTLSTVTDLAPPDDSVARRLSASTPVNDPSTVANALRQDESTRLAITATLHFRQPGTDQIDPGGLHWWPPHRRIPIGKLKPGASIGRGRSCRRIRRRRSTSRRSRGCRWPTPAWTPGSSGCRPTCSGCPTNPHLRPPPPPSP